MEIPVINSEKTEETVIEVLKFINIDCPDFQDLKNEKISKEKATKEILRLFKTISFTAQEVRKAKKRQKKLKKQEKKLKKKTKSKKKLENFVSSSENSSSVKKEYLLIPNEVKEICPLIIDSEKMKQSTERISKYEFFQYMIECTYALLRVHNLKIEILDSTSKNALYVKVIASENTLLNYAFNMKYQLKVKRKPEWVSDFQQQSLYIPITTNENLDKMNTFVNYDQYGQETDNGSILTFNDKYLLVNSVLAKTIDLSVLASNGIMLNRFILHQQVPIDEMKEEWADFSKFFKPLPSNLIKTYFSEQIAFYFNFLHLLKDFIKVLAILGLLIYSLRIINHYFVNSDYMFVIYEFYCVFLIIWGLAFNKVFERKEKELALAWGTLDFSGDHIQRQEFKGTYMKDEPSGEMKIINTHPIRYFFIRIASFIASGSFMMLGILSNLAIPLLFQYLTGVEYAGEVYANSKEYQLLGGVMFGIQINVFNITYNIIARKLTNAENHETIQEHNNSLILKLFIFRFVNSYLNLFHIAFLKKKEKCEGHSCMSELGYRLMAIFSTCLVFNFIEIGMPWVKYWIRTKKTFGSFNLRNSVEISEDLLKIEQESMLEPYDNTINDYMELCTMFGYIALFGTSHHLVGILALIALYFESRIDALKLCTILRRPEPFKTNSIGIWKKLFLFISLCGIFTNVGISVFTTGLLNGLDRGHRALLFIFIENSMLLAAAVIWAMVSSVTNVVNQGKNWAKITANQIKLGDRNLKSTIWRKTRYGNIGRFEFDINRKNVIVG